VGIVLASRSPRRTELLTAHGVVFTVVPADIDESVHAGENPHDYVGRMSMSKHAVVAARHARDTVIAADTIVELGGAIHGQPVDADDARRILGALSGRTHHVHTCVTVGTAGHATSTVVTSRVTFRPLSPGLVEWYLGTGEWAGKAGSYAVQGLGIALVAGVRGSLSNVIGLPVAETLALLH
jgi:septum formation protein